MVVSRPGVSPSPPPQGSPDTQGRSGPLSWLRPYLSPAIATSPRLAVPVTRGFGDSFRKDQPQRGGLGHGVQDRLAVAQGWFPSVFSISTACTTATRWLQRGQVPKFILSKNSPGVCLSAGMTCGGHGCHRPGKAAIGIFNNVWTMKGMLRWEKGRSDLAEVAAVQRPGRTQWGGANEITRLTKRKPKLREAALLMRLFGVTNSPAHTCRRRHVQCGLCCGEEGSPHPTSPQAATP